jgi:hypothetical protein
MAIILPYSMSSCIRSLAESAELVGSCDESLPGAASGGLPAGSGFPRGWAEGCVSVGISSQRAADSWHRILWTTPQAADRHIDEASANNMPHVVRLKDTSHTNARGLHTIQGTARRPQGWRKREKTRRKVQQSSVSAPSHNSLSPLPPSFFSRSCPSHKRFRAVLSLDTSPATPGYLHLPQLPT